MTAKQFCWAGLCRVGLGWVGLGSLGWVGYRDPRGENFLVADSAGVAEELADSQRDHVCYPLLSSIHVNFMTVIFQFESSREILGAPS